MNGLVPVIDQVIASLDRGQIEVSNQSELREALLLLRSIALEREPEGRKRPTSCCSRAPGIPKPR